MPKVPERPVVGKKRYRAVFFDPREKPYKEKIETVGVDERMHRTLIERCAREAAKEAGFVFIRLEVVA